MDIGGSFVKGDGLVVDANGRPVNAHSGDGIVAGALNRSSGAGDTAYITYPCGQK